MIKEEEEVQNKIKKLVDDIKRFTLKLFNIYCSIMQQNKNRSFFY